MVRSIVWVPIWNADRPGVGIEHLVLSESSADSVVIAFDEQGHAFRLSYRLEWDASWRLRRAHLVVTTQQGERTLTLESDGHGHWRAGDGVVLSHLDGCIDIDIWPTPFTNTFPVRRESLRAGESRDLVVAWVSAPALTVERAPQRYTRLDERRYLFESIDGSGFRAELPVDDDGVVLDYERTFRRIT